MSKKNCIKCLKLKPLSEFSRNSGLKSFRGDCKECFNKEGRIRSRTKNGLLLRIYSHQKRNSKVRRHPVPEYDFNELKKWALSKQIFHKLHADWAASGYDKNLTPSFDRTDDYKGYSLERLTIMTWADHSEKSLDDLRIGTNNKLSKAVIQMEINGSFVAKYHSAWNAFRVTGISQGNLSSCCRGERRQAGGFKWKFA